MKRLLFLCFLLLASPALAGDALVTSEVTVDVTGKDAADARTQAMTKGELDALTDLLNKLTAPGQSQDIIARLDAKKISALVRGVEVLDEKITSDRYRAKLIVSFDADEISALVGKLAAADAADAGSVTTGAFLVIPFYEEEGNKLLWESDNPWASAWKSLGLEVISGDIVVAYGDATDSGIVDTKTISAANYSALSPLAIRYGVTDILILEARYSRAPEMLLTVVKRRINRARNEVNLLTFRADPQETRDTLLARAARDIVDNLQNQKSEEVTAIRSTAGGERGKIMVLASIGTLRAWTDIRARLSSMTMIERIELIAMSPQQVDMQLHYRGSLESLATALEAQKLRLNKNNPAFWVISRD
jgi:hypothetical protein